MSGPKRGRFKHLKRIVAAEPQTDEEIQILGLELYEDGFALRWGALPSEPGGMPGIVENAGLDPVQFTQLTYGALPSMVGTPFPEAVDEDWTDPFELLKVHDDLGTSYAPAGWSGEAIRGIAYFEPAIPDEAIRLEVSVRDKSLRFDLASD